MNHQISLFFLVLSILYLTRFVIEFVIRLTQETPTPIQISKLEQIAQLLSLSYIITYFLN